MLVFYNPNFGYDRSDRIWINLRNAFEEEPQFFCRRIGLALTFPPETSQGFNIRTASGCTVHLDPYSHAVLAVVGESAERDPLLITRAKRLHLEPWIPFWTQEKSHWKSTWNCSRRVLAATVCARKWQDQCRG